MTPESAASLWGLGPGDKLWSKFFEMGRTQLIQGPVGPVQYSGPFIGQLLRLEKEKAALAAWTALLGRSRQHLQNECIKTIQHRGVWIILQDEVCWSSEPLRKDLDSTDLPWVKMLGLLGLVQHARFSEWNREYLVGRRHVRRR